MAIDGAMLLGNVYIPNRLALFAGTARAAIIRNSSQHKSNSIFTMEATTLEPFSIAIVGGGLAGLSLARGLLRRGVSCQVFEAATAFAEIGAGLSFAKNSLDALKAVDPACHAMFAKRCNDTSEKQDVYMTYRDGQAAGDAPITTLYCEGSGQQAVHRTLLVKVCPIPRRRQADLGLT